MQRDIQFCLDVIGLCSFLSGCNWNMFNALWLCIREKNIPCCIFSNNELLKTKNWELPTFFEQFQKVLPSIIFFKLFSLEDASSFLANIPNLFQSSKKESYGMHINSAISSLGIVWVSSQKITFYLNNDIQYSIVFSSTHKYFDILSFFWVCVCLSLSEPLCRP